MRLAANLLLVVAFLAGIFGAVTAYLPPLSLPDSQLAGLTLNAPAGRQVGPSGLVGPLAAKDSRLTPALIQALRAQGVRRVRVKQFAFSRWSGSWLFLAGCVGLIAAAWMSRAATRRTIAAARRQSAARGETAETILTAIRTGVDGLRAEWPDLPDVSARHRRVLAVLTDAQDNLVPAFAARQALITSRLGLAGYARLMDRFAAGERQLNRAWSAATDGIEAEVLICLERASVHLADAARCLEQPESAE